MKRSAIDENAASFRQFYPIVSGKTYCRTFVDKQEFQFMDANASQSDENQIPKYFPDKRQKGMLGSRGQQSPSEYHPYKFYVYP